MIDKLPEAQLDANAFWPAQHTYTQFCDGLHPPGPCPGQENRDLRVQVSKLDVKAGDCILVRVPGTLNAQMAAEISSRIRDIIGVPVRVLVTDTETEVTVEAAE
jgi:hypothetical protein